MRLIFLLIAMLAFVAPSLASTQAVYHVAGEDREMLVEVDDAGHARLGAVDDDDFYVLLDGSAAYIVTSIGDGDYDYLVARPEDAVAAVRTAKIRIPDVGKMPPVGNIVLGPPVTRGHRIVAGIAGSVVLLRKSGATSDAGAMELVVADDPALRPVGQAMQRSARALLALVPLIGGATADHVRLLDRVLSGLDGGMLLAIGKEITLRSLTTGNVVSPTRLQLPANPKTIAELVAIARAHAAEK